MLPWKAEGELSVLVTFSAHGQAGLQFVSRSAAQEEASARHMTAVLEQHVRC